MDKKGFTLIELLAVIVILAIVAVIAVPLIFGIIEKVKKSALGSTANGLMDSAEVYYTKNLEGTGENKVFLFDDSRNGETVDGEKISYKGSFDGTGSVRLYSNGKTAICITDGKYYALKNVSDNKVKTGSGTCSYDSETESYLSVDLVSKEQLDALQAQLDQIQSEKQLIVDAITTKGVAASISEDLSSLATKINAISLGKKITLLGTATSYNLKTNYATYGLGAEDYKNLTVDSFIAGISGMSEGSYGSPTTMANGSYQYATAKIKSISYNKQYDANTGILTITATAKINCTQVTAGWVPMAGVDYSYTPSTFVYLISE